MALDQHTLLYLLLGFPLLALILNVLFYRLISGKVSGWIATSAVLLSTLCSWFLWGTFERETSWTLYSWISISDFSVDIGFLLDPLSLIMLMVVTTVSACVHLYSIEYMEHDEGISRFFIYLNLFVFSMLILVTAKNLLMMFIGWEGVGLCSYLLIGFWYEDDAPRWAGQKAFVVNRIGDFSFLVGLFMIVYTVGSLQFGSLHMAIESVPQRFLTAIGLLLFGGAVGKSAQFPLYVWLPDAMEGPTPVSSLIHAATMVTAGVYLIARLHFLYKLILPVGLVIASVGAFTALFSATIALVRTDMKRILAYSTISQLGYMFAAVGLGAYGAGVFHLATHAFFKGLLFLVAGSVMHALHGELNIFNMDRLSEDMPITSTMGVIGGLGLAGVPPLAGFFSKDQVLAATLKHHHLTNWVLFTVLSVAALITSFYTFRMIFEAFWSDSQDRSNLPEDVHECGWKMALPMGLLAFGTILGSYFGNWTALLSHGGTHGGPKWLIMTVSSLVSIGGLILAYLVYVRSMITPDELYQKGKTIWELLDRQYYVETIYQSLIVGPFRKFAHFSWTYIDDLLIDGLANAFASAVDLTGLVIRFIQTGYVRHYLFLLAMFITGILWIVGLTVIGL